MRKTYIMYYKCVYVHLCEAGHAMQDRIDKSKASNVKSCNHGKAYKNYEDVQYTHRLNRL